MHPITLLCISSQLAAVILFPLWFLTDGVLLTNELIHGSLSHNGSPDFYFLFLLIASGFCSFLQNICAFVLIHQLTTLSYAVSFYSSLQNSQLYFITYNFFFTGFKCNQTNCSYRVITFYLQKSCHSSQLFWNVFSCDWDVRV